jgi:hypothetical protein
MQAAQAAPPNPSQAILSRHAAKEAVQAAPAAKARKTIKLASATAAKSLAARSLAATELPVAKMRSPHRLTSASSKSK